MSKKRLPPAERREYILDAAISLAKQHGYNQITRDAIASHAGIATGLLNQRFGTMVKFRRALMRHAIQNEVLEVIAQGLAAGDEHARKAPQDLKQRAMDHMINA